MTGPPLLIFGNIGVWEYVIIGAVIMLLFGARRIPEVARSLGRGIVEFKRGLKGEDEPGKLPPPPPTGGPGPNPPPPPA